MRSPFPAVAIAAVVLAFPPSARSADLKGGPPRIEPGAPKTHDVRVTAPRHDYRVGVGGTADMDNTTVLDYGDVQTVIGFRNNVSLEIANTGRVPVVNPRVVVNDRGR